MSRHFIKSAIIIGILLLGYGVVLFLNQNAILTNFRGAILSLLTPVLRVTQAARHLLPSEAGNPEEKLLSCQAARTTLEEENQRLQNALDFREQGALPLIAARVLRYDRELGIETLLIDRGTEDGVRENAWVIDADRVAIGRIQNVAAQNAHVSIASNPNFLTEVFFPVVGTGALASGLGARAFAVELLSNATTTAIGRHIVIFPDGSRLASFVLGAIVYENTDAGASLREARAVLVAKPEILREVFVLQTGE